MAIPDPKFRRIRIEDSRDAALKWGRLVKTWATGLNYVDYPPHPRPGPTNALQRPGTFKEFVEQCQKLNIKLSYDDGLTPTPVSPTDPITLVMLPHTTDTLIIRLSPPEFLEKSEGDLKVDEYPVAEFYGDILMDANPKPDEVDTMVKVLDIHAMRVGEYTIAMCQ
jgi:hypothetical protein